ncbi:MAG: hypothetical protein OEX00_11855, partial [Gammaproteobacteria bacterium]|nr:hypothetical protein [Gammaproteobacteria bacterium]
EFQSQHNHEAMLMQIQQRIDRNSRIASSESEPAPWFSWNRLAYALPVVAVMVFATLLLNQTPTNVTTTGIGEDIGIRLKGAKPHLKLYLNTKEGPQSVAENQPLKQGDQLQLSYIAAGFNYGMIISIDGNGMVTKHFPYEQHSLFTVNPSGEFMLHNSYVLDNAPRFEHFYFLYAEKKIDFEKMIPLIEAQAAHINETQRELSGLPQGMEQSIFTIRKMN